MSSLPRLESFCRSTTGNKIQLSTRACIIWPLPVSPSCHTLPCSHFVLPTLAFSLFLSVKLVPLSGLPYLLFHLPVTFFPSVFPGRLLLVI